MVRQLLTGPGSPTRVFPVAVASDRDLASTGFAARQRRAAVGWISVFVACVAAAAAQAPAPDTWPQFRGGPTLAGVAAGPLSPTLKVAWSH